MMTIDINKLGEKLTNCGLQCEGIINTRRENIPPRYLIHEKRPGNGRSIVVGLNPGKISEHERKYFTDNKISYLSTKQCFYRYVSNKGIFKPTRTFLSKLGFKGDLLWTNLVKCQCKGENGDIPIQTLRICIHRFLKNEIEQFECSTIFALGNVAFNYCALSFPNHFVIGLPHPTGSHGIFTKLSQDKSSLPKYRKIMKTPVDAQLKFRALHLARPDSLT